MKSFTKKMAQGEPLNTESIRNAFEDEPHMILAAEIVVGAVHDWRLLMKRKAWLDEHPERYCNFTELRSFFNGKWCAFIMQNFDAEPARILEILEKELADAMRKDG